MQDLGSGSLAPNPQFLIPWLVLLHGAEGTLYCGLLNFKQLRKPLNFAYAQLGVISVVSACSSAHLASGAALAPSYSCLLSKHLNSGCPLEAPCGFREMMRPIANEVNKGPRGWGQEQVFSKSSQVSPMALMAGNFSPKS